MSQYPKEQWCTCVGADGIKGEYPPKAGEDHTMIVLTICVLIVGYLFLMYRKNK
jgi:hypothetical protein